MGRTGGAPRAPGRPQGGSEYQAAVSQVFQMSTGLTGLRRMIDMLGGPKDTVELRQRASEQKEKIAAMAKSVTAHLKKMQAPGGASPAEKASVVKLASDFEGILKEFQRMQKLLADKGTHHKPKGSSVSAAESLAAADASTSGLSLEQQEEQALLQREQSKQQMIQLDNMIDYNTALIEERDEGIAEIQQQIGEVNEMFQDLAVLVNDQGTQLLDIEANVLSAAERTAQATNELTRARKSQKRNRRCWCWITLITLLVIGFLVFLLSLN